MRGLWGNVGLRASLTLFLSDVLFNIGIFAWSARDQVLTIYSADPTFAFRGLLIGAIVSLPLVVFLEAMNAVRRVVMSPIFAVIFTLTFFASLVVIQRYGASFDTGFLIAIDNIWLQFVCVYGLSLFVAGIVLIVAMRIFARAHLKHD